MILARGLVQCLLFVVCVSLCLAASFGAFGCANYGCGFVCDFRLLCV